MQNYWKNELVKDNRLFITGQGGGDIEGHQRTPTPQSYNARCGLLQP
jgi:hypothetical protein